MKHLISFSFFIFLMACGLTMFSQTSSVEIDHRNTDFVIEDNGLPFPDNYKEWWETGNFFDDYVINNKIFNSDFILTRTDFIIKRSNGYVGLGAPNPTAQLHTNGSVRFQGLGLGTLQTDANGNVSASSDVRLKDVVGMYTHGLNEIIQLEPIQFKWKQGTGMDTDQIYTGFSAQNVNDALPEAVGKDVNGYLSLSDRSILAALVNAVKDLKSENEKLRSQIIELQSMNN